MTNTVSSKAFFKLFRQDTPLLDVRAPCEFSRGAFPNTINLPLLSDSEREAVGTVYKRDGKSAAIALGHRLVNSEAKERLLVSWMDYINTSPNAVLLCQRGGLRSQTVQTWLAEAGCTIVRAQGGYKSLRRHLIDATDQFASSGQLVLVEYRAEDPRVPIKRLHKMSEVQVRQEMAAIGLDWVRTESYLPQQHVLVFQKPRAQP